MSATRVLTSATVEVSTFFNSDSTLVFNFANSNLTEASLVLAYASAAAPNATLKVDAKAEIVKVEAAADADVKAAVAELKKLF